MLNTKNRKHYAIRFFCYICFTTNSYNMAKIIGIYKITSPSGKVYIGQSHDLELRFKLYSKLKCAGQRALYCSLNKYGYDAHTVEVIHQLPYDITQSVMDEYECLYINFYIECGIKLMNLKGGGSKGKHSDETRKLISKRITGRTISEAHRKKISENFSGEKHPFYGKKASKTHCENISKGLKGKPKSKEHKEMVSKGLKGKYLGIKKPNGHGDKVSQARKGIIFSEDHRKNIGLKSLGRNPKPMFQISLNGEIVKEWPSIVIAASELRIKSSNIVNCARGRDKTYKGFLWKYK